MKIVFRLKYRTVVGQSLWLKYSTVLGDEGIRFDQEASLRWRNENEWEATVKVKGAGKFRIEYSYQLRDDRGVELDEWSGPREADVDFSEHDSVVLLDTWCSAGTVDYAFETDALRAVLPERGPFAEVPVPEGANHTFQLRMAAVPAGQVPCLLGSVAELGNWGWFSAIPLIETSANVWQAKVHLPPDWYIEYKYGLFDTKLQCVVAVESGDNRRLEPHGLAARQWTKIHDECYRRGTSGLYRGAGVAVPVFSLRGEQSMGVGEFADLKPFADWAKSAGLALIQILPINDTTSSHQWTDSYPYSAISVYALHPIYLRVSDLPYAMPDSFAAEIADARGRLDALGQVDYEAVMRAKLDLAGRIFSKHQEAIVADASFQEFLAEQRDWLIPYAAFCILRDRFGTADFSNWEDGWRYFDRQRAETFAEAGHLDFAKAMFHCWLQYELDRQLADAVAHMHEVGVALKGDLPIGIDRESVDAWAAPHLFKMDAQAGAPPDAFAVKGQNWGFPTYNWEVMKLDGYAWWQSRFAHLSRYFDAFRIDHILGFFRIWQVPTDHVEGIMGQFDPAWPIELSEIVRRGIPFDYNRYCRPYIREYHLRERFGDATDYVKETFLHNCGDGYFQLREQVLNQRRIAEYFEEHPHDEFVKTGLLDCASEVLFFEVPGSRGQQFHPRCAMKATKTFQELDGHTRWLVEELYNDYFFRRQEPLWEARGLELLPVMRRASTMLLCGEDLGMVPACVPGVLEETGILSLEIQRMPKVAGLDFVDPEKIPYMSVVSTSTHDMSPIRSWWKEDPQLTARYAWQCFGLGSPPAELSGEMASWIIAQHLHFAAMWAIFPLQDLLAMDESLRLPDPDAERINVPAIIPFYWRYRMHLSIADLAKADNFNNRLRQMIESAGRR